MLDDFIERELDFFEDLIEQPSDDEDTTDITESLDLIFRSCLNDIGVVDDIVTTRLK